jgi:hypothetical protein
MMPDQIPLAAIGNLLKKAGLSPSIKNITRCLSGGNNRTYRITTKEGVFAVKQYFRQVDDTRDRLHAEFSFLTYAKRAAPQFVPVPYAQDVYNALALYEFIDGTPLKSNDITDQEIHAAIDFFTALNAAGHRQNADKLALASEACFSLQEHVNLIDDRLRALKDIAPITPEDKLAKKFTQELTLTWNNIVKKILTAIQNDYFTETLSFNQRCISPSDFGFHNALKLRDGSIRFLDFEYGGWDDPAKMVGDFFSQLAIPIPAKFFHTFTKQVMQVFPCPDDLIKRAIFLRHVYQVKWCCIVLNIFLPSHLERRRFANPNLNITSLKRTQLTKASGLLKLLEYQNQYF